VDAEDATGAALGVLVLQRDDLDHPGGLATAARPSAWNGYFSVTTSKPSSFASASV
jgi:hypothetical protein